MFQSIVKSLQQRGLNEIDLNNMDEYWVIQAPEWTNFDKQPEELSVGSLYDDWMELQKTREGRMPTAVDLDRLAAVLRAISAHIAPPA